MQFIKPGLNIDFVGKKGYAIALSCILIAVGVASLILKGGPRYGIDFAGGTLVQVRFQKPTSPTDIRKGLETLQLKDVLIQSFGERKDHEYLIRLPQSDASLQGLADRISKALEGHYGKDAFEVRRVEMVGPKVGGDLRRKGLLSILYAVIGILIYVAWRFQINFGVGAVLALLHDVAVTVGVLSLTEREFTLQIVAALLTILGFSINDTIVVFDRIRENRRKSRKDPLEKTINRSINETLSRTILTSGTVLIVLVSLLLLGGEVIRDFAFTLLIGVVVGTYSSIYIASPVVIYWEKLWGKDRTRRRKKESKG